MKRGAVRKATSKLVLVWFPDSILPLIDDAVRKLDTDRSKFIRNAVREAMARAGVRASDTDPL